MGICMSHELESLEIHESKHSQDNAVYYGETDGPNELPKNGSLCSQVGSKGTNQDAAILYQGYGEKDGTFCSVFDGHGKNGHIVSKLVRNRLPSLILNQRNALVKLNKNTNDKDTCKEMEMESNLSYYRWREACFSAFKAMDKELKLVDGLDCSCSGTTAVVVIKQGKDLVIANLGDSRAILGTVSDDGALKVVQLTTDLKPGLPSEAERIRKCNGRVLSLKEEPHIQRVWLPYDDSPGLAMSRAIGDFVLKKHGVISIPDICYNRISDSDGFIVLASDGVWDVLSNEDVAAIVLEVGNEEDAAKAVVDKANSTWKSKFQLSKVDDCSVVCLFL